MTAKSFFSTQWHARVYPLIGNRPPPCAAHSQRDEDDSSAEDAAACITDSDSDDEDSGTAVPGTIKLHETVHHSCDDLMRLGGAQVWLRSRRTSAL